jgi:E3 ubiquitin-protein ligase ZNF598
MAAANATTFTPEPNSEPSAPNQRRSDGQRTGRGRGRGRGTGGQDFLDGQSKRQEGAGGRRGRGASRGANSSHAKSNSTTMNTSDIQTRFAPSSVPTGQSEQASQSSEQRRGAPDKPETEPEVCFICASPVEHYSVAPCNHRTCHICALRMRALYKTKDCAHCRVSLIPKCPPPFKVQTLTLNNS